jgi:hypothetical protein
MQQPQPWIGFVHVQAKSDPNPLGEGLKGAFSHVIALAVDTEDFMSRVISALESEGLFAIEFKDVSPVTRYRDEDRISPDMEVLIKSLSLENPVQFDTFDAYREYNA